MDWKNTFKRIEEFASPSHDDIWKYGQENTVRWIAKQLREDTRKGVLVADEVGMGKTRAVMAAMLSVLENGGRVAVIVPPGLLCQWKEEWDKFIETLNGKKSDVVSDENREKKRVDYAPILLRSYNSMFDDGGLEYPLSENNGKWLLISHQFGSPSLKNNSHSWRYLLPALVKALQKEDQGKNRRNSYWQLVKKWYRDCIRTDCSECKEKGDCPPWFSMMNKAAIFLRKEGRWRLIDKIPKRDLESKKSKDEFKKWFDGKNGISMLGELLGPIDLLVIDEAHKNRNEEGRLEKLLKMIKNPSAKRIAMTATPMELDPAQWEDLFKRIGEIEQYLSKEKEIEEFNETRKEANIHPNNPEVLEKLISASEGFNKALAPYVTRRLRIKQDEMIEILGLKSEKEIGSAHPHRKFKPIKINYHDINAKWKSSVFALEAIGKAAKGLMTNDKDFNRHLGMLKIADSRYAAAQISNSENDEEELLDSSIDKYLEDYKQDPEQSLNISKLKRIQYWRKVLKQDDADLPAHPRIQIVADKIEKLLWNEDGSIKHEKAIVFGTFNKPLKALRDVLNRRAVLRFLDRNRKADGDRTEPPIPPGPSHDKKNIWIEYLRIIKNQNSLQLTRKYSSEKDLDKAIDGGCKSYESIRDKLRDPINEEFIGTIPGDAALKGFVEKVAELLRYRLTNDIICTNEDADNLNPKEIKNKALKIWCEYLNEYLDFEGDAGKTAETKTLWEKPDYFELKYFCGSSNASDLSNEEKKMKNLDRFADNELGEDTLKKLIDDETVRIGSFASSLDGSVKMERRNVLKAQFNDKLSLPKVLIAQSQVGREGLNLHEACRTIIQFHSEWNPGVIEQQIGRVDRINSFWEELVKNKKKEKQNLTWKDDDFPKMVIYPVMFEGTYDNFQFNVSKHRQETLNAHLFGELLSAEALEKMPKEGREWEGIRNKLRESAPDFSPPKYMEEKSSS